MTQQRVVIHAHYHWESTASVKLHEKLNFECQVTRKAHQISGSVFCNSGWEMNHVSRSYVQRHYGPPSMMSNILFSIHGEEKQRKWWAFFYVPNGWSVILTDDSKMTELLAAALKYCVFCCFWKPQKMQKCVSYSCTSCLFKTEAFVCAKLKQSRLSQRTALKIAKFLQLRVAGLLSLLPRFSAGPTAQHLELWSFKPLSGDMIQPGQCRTARDPTQMWECFNALSQSEQQTQHAPFYITVWTLS